MAKKKVGIWMDEGVAKRLDELADRYEGQKGELVSAAVTMFLDASLDAQRSALEKSMTLKIHRLFGNPELKLTQETMDALSNADKKEKARVAAQRRRTPRGTHKKDPDKLGLE